MSGVNSTVFFSKLDMLEDDFFTDKNLSEYDADGDNSLSEDEFIKAVNGNKIILSYLSEFSDDVGSVFYKAAGSDKKISLDGSELTNLHKEFENKAKSILEATNNGGFQNALENDNDGGITYDEFKDIIKNDEFLKDFAVGREDNMMQLFKEMAGDDNIINTPSEAEEIDKSIFSVDIDSTSLGSANGDHFRKQFKSDSNKTLNKDQVLEQMKNGNSELEWLSKHKAQEITDIYTDVAGSDGIINNEIEAADLDLKIQELIDSIEKDSVYGLRDIDDFTANLYTGTNITFADFKAKINENEAISWHFKDKEDKLNSIFNDAAGSDGVISSDEEAEKLDKELNELIKVIVADINQKIKDDQYLSDQIDKYNKMLRDATNEASKEKFAAMMTEMNAAMDEMKAMSSAFSSISNNGTNAAASAAKGVMDGASAIGNMRQAAMTQGPKGPPAPQ